MVPAVELSPDQVRRFGVEDAPRRMDRTGGSSPHRRASGTRPVSRMVASRTQVLLRRVFQGSFSPWGAFSCIWAALRASSIEDITVALSSDNAQGALRILRLSGYCTMAQPPRPERLDY